MSLLCRGLCISLPYLPINLVKCSCYRARTARTRWWGLEHFDASIPEISALRITGKPGEGSICLLPLKEGHGDGLASARSKDRVTAVWIQSGRYTSQEGNFPYVDGQAGDDRLVIEEIYSEVP